MQVETQSHESALFMRSVHRALSAYYILHSLTPYTTYYTTVYYALRACMQVGRGIDSGAYAHEHFKRDDPEDIRVHIYTSIT
jgi:hypothetical protein